MLRLAIKTRMTPEEIRVRAIDFFGPDGYGLEAEERSATSLLFRGAGGSLELITEPLDGDETSVDILSKDWEYQARRFIEEVLEV